VVQALAAGDYTVEASGTSALRGARKHEKYDEMS
jgi:hypothetical protein